MKNVGKNALLICRNGARSIQATMPNILSGSDDGARIVLRKKLNIKLNIGNGIVRSITLIRPLLKNARRNGGVNTPATTKRINASGICCKLPSQSDYPKRSSKFSDLGWMGRASCVER